MLCGKYYRYKGNGAIYKAVALSKGAGKLRGTELVIYECPETGAHYHREVNDFAVRMELISKPAPPDPPESRIQCTCGRTGKESQFKPCWACRNLNK